MMRAERRRHAPLEAARIAGLRGREPARGTRNLGVETPSRQTAESGGSYWVESIRKPKTLLRSTFRILSKVYTSSLSKHWLSIPSVSRHFAAAHCFAPQPHYPSPFYGSVNDPDIVGITRRKPRETAPSDTGRGTDGNSSPPPYRQSSPPK